MLFRSRAFIACGMNDVVHKPLQRDSLYHAIRLALTGTTETVVAGEEHADDWQCQKSQLLIDLESQLGGARLSDLLSQLAHDINSNLKDALAGAANREIDRLARACHSLQGLCASFGISELKDLSGCINDLCRKGEVQRAVTITLTELESVCLASLDRLATYQEAMLTQE